MSIPLDPLDYSDPRAVDGKDGRKPDTVESDAMEQGGHPVCQPRERSSRLVGVVGKDLVVEVEIV